MIIGFIQRRQTISESDARSGELTLVVGSLRISEIEYETQFRVLETGNANVEAHNMQFSTRFDALFGIRDSEGDSIEDSRPLTVGNQILETVLTTTVINDFIPENVECYEIRIFRPDVGFRSHNSFTCNEDEGRPVNFFCLHTICIEDDDG